MKKKNDVKEVPFPFSIWFNMTVGTRRMIIGGIILIIIVSMITGYFPELVNLVKPGAKQ